MMSVTFTVLFIMSHVTVSSAIRPLAVSSMRYDLSLFKSLAVLKASGIRIFCLSVCLSVFLSVSLSVRLSVVCLSVYMYVCLSVSLSVYLSVCLSVCLCV